MSAPIEAALRANEARQAFLVQLSDALRPVTDPLEIQATAARVLGEWLDVTRVAYFQVVDGDDYVVEREYTRDVPQLLGRYPVASFGPELLAAYCSGRTAFAENVASDATLAAEAHAAFAAIQIASYVGAPLVKDGRLVAGLAVHHAEPRAWTENDLKLVEETAERTWSAVERARAETALRESEAKYRMIFDSIDEGLAVVQMIFDDSGYPVDYRFQQVNRLFEEQTGLHGATGRTASELVPGLEAHWFEVYGRVASTGEPVRFQNGSEPMGRWFDVFAFPVGEPAARQVGILFRDVTAVRAAERELERLLTEAQEARAEAEAANLAKSDFLATMSHELRTPLNAIGGYVELLELGIRGPTTEAQRIDLARIQQSQRHLLGLINQVLNYARVDAGAVHYDLAVVQIADALATAEALVLPQARARGLTAVLGDCPSGLAVCADSDKLQQILLNLLTNAIKFTDAGGEVCVSCAEQERMVSISISDTGIGIAPDKVSKIFEPFIQVDQRLTRPHEGVGLGLAISRDLARGMAGNLTAESALGAGSTFTLTLPRA